MQSLLLLLLVLLMALLTAPVLRQQTTAAVRPAATATVQHLKLRPQLSRYLLHLALGSHCMRLAAAAAAAPSAGLQHLIHGSSCSLQHQLHQDLQQQ
jgi:hypothetical protein